MAKTHYPSISTERAGTARRMAERGSIRRAQASAALWAFLTFLVLAPARDLTEEDPGAVAGRDVRAHDRIEVPDFILNMRERENVRRGHDRIWTFQPGVKDKALARLASAFAVLKAAKPASGTEVRAVAEDLYAKAGIRLRSEDLDALYKTANLPLLEDNLRLAAERTLDSRMIVADKGFFTANRNLRRISLQGVSPEFMNRLYEQEPLGWPADVRRHLAENELRQFYPSGADVPLIDTGVKILMQTLGPNLDYDRSLSETMMTGRLRDLENRPLMKVFERGDFIVHEGDPINQTQAAALKAVNAELRRRHPFRVAGVAALTALCFYAGGLYLSRVRREFAFTPATVAMLCLPVVTILAAGRMTVLLGVEPDIQRVIFPAPLAGMLTAIMVGPQAAFVLVLFSGILFGVAMDQGLDFQVVALFGGFTAVIALRSIRERKDVLSAGVRVAAVNMAAVTVLALVNPPLIFPAEKAAWAGLNGLACAMLTLPLMVIFERAFGVVTEIRLLEITGPQHPLMRMMEEKAPGSYQHVLNVTKLAESAAEEIGANYLLTRAGAYFHDVGKMLKPKFFSENQVTLEDKKSHSRLSPYMSTLIIKNHVKEGVELAKRHGLPKSVIDFIPQHHGTSLIKYFYNEALRRYQDSESVDPVREEDFRYPGPRPQSIEAGVVMLADSVEAIVTSVFTQSQVNENDLRRVVGQAIQDRFNDGQFDECDLTMRDLHLIRESFVKSLKARFHHRIAYPTREPAPSAPLAAAGHGR